jgi:hypothetical protein
VELSHWGLTTNFEVAIEGLPKGWTGSSVNVGVANYRQYVAPLATRFILTITAPADASKGTAVPFKVMGRTRIDGKLIEREAQYMTLYGNSHNDRMFLRPSPIARAAVTDYMDAWPTTEVKELTVVAGETVQIPVKFNRKAGEKPGAIGVVVNGPTVAANCGMGPPVAMKPDQDTLMMPLTIPATSFLGTRGIVVARSWSSDIRGGRPGPCTPLILLHIKSKDGK